MKRIISALLIFAMISVNTFAIAEENGGLWGQIGGFLGGVASGAGDMLDQAGDTLSKAGEAAGDPAPRPPPHPAHRCVPRGNIPQSAVCR